MNSILNTVKKLLGISEDNVAFDTDIIVLINSAFATCHQLGVGPSEVFSIEDESASWDDFKCDKVTASLIKHYIYMKVRITFDPPSGNSILEALKELIKEYEWRMYTNSDSLSNNQE